MRRIEVCLALGVVVWGLGCAPGEAARQTATAHSVAGAPSTEVTTPPPPSATAHGVAHGRFTETVEFAGPCVERRECYRLTLLPDGTVRFWALDAMMGGTYEVAGDRLHYRRAKGLPTDADVVVTYVTTDGFETFAQEGVAPGPDSLFRRKRS